MPEQTPVPPRSAQSVQAEASYRDWTEAPEAERPLVRTRTKHAAALETAMKQHGVSRARLAMMLGLADRQVAKYLDGSKPIPTTIEDVLPTEMRITFVRLRSAGTAAAGFRAALARLEEEGASPELIAEGHMRLGALSARGPR